MKWNEILFFEEGFLSVNQIKNLSFQIALDEICVILQGFLVPPTNLFVCFAQYEKFGQAIFASLSLSLSLQGDNCIRQMTSFNQRVVASNL